MLEHRRSWLPEIWSVFGDSIVVVFLSPLWITEQLVSPVDLDKFGLGIFVLVFVRVPFFGKLFVSFSARNGRLL